MANIPTHRELTNYESWQLEKYGNIEPELVPDPQRTTLDVLNEDEMRRMEEWMNLQAEMQNEKAY